MQAYSPSSDQDPLLAALLAYDDALASGQDPSAARKALTGSSDESVTLQGEANDATLDEYCSLLDLMEHVWPRHPAEADPDGQADAAAEIGTSRVGRFRIVRELGRGGFGIVYLAEDPKLGRNVALKLPRPEMLLTREMRRRLLREAQATAALSHPHIVPLFETGEIDTICYLVSPYCAGGTLSEHLSRRDRPLSPREAAWLVLLLAEATHYAHTKGILHRDLKPGNVLVEVESGTSAKHDLDFVPRIADFGLAQFVEHEAGTGISGHDPGILATCTGAVFGTPRYMAPEQAEGRREAIGPATDVYGLGTILYETLTGRPPFAGPGKLELLRQVLEKEPLAPRQLRSDIPRDLEAICLKCLEKRPARRYANAEELAADLRRFLAGQPTQARPLTYLERTARWMRRHPVLAAWITAAMLAVVVALAGLAVHSARVEAYAAALEGALERETKQTREANRQRRLAEERELAARQESYASEMGRAWRMWQNGEGLALCELLNHHRPAAGQPDVRGFAWHYLWSLGCNAAQLRGHLTYVYELQFSSDGLHCATWNPAAEYARSEQQGDSAAIIAKEQAIFIWHIPTRSLRWRLETDGPPQAACFTADGSRIVSVCGSGTIQAWNIESGQKLSSMPGPRLRPSVSYRSAPYSIVAFSPNAETFAYTTVGRSDDGELVNGLHIWNLQAGESRPLPKLAAPCANSARFSADGKMLAVGSHTQSRDRSAVQIYDAVHCKLLKSCDSLNGSVVAKLAFSADRRMLVIGTWRGSVAFWDLVTDKLEQHRLASEETEVHVDMSPDGTTIASGFNGGSPNENDHVLLWQGVPGAVQAKPPAPGAGTTTVAFSPDGEILAYGGKFRLWRIRQHEEFLPLSGHRSEAWCVAFAPEGRLLASASDDHTVKLWNLETGEEQTTLTGHQSLVAAVAFSPDGQTLATASFDQSIKLWEVSSGQEQRTLTGHSGSIRGLAFHANGKLLASISDDRTVRVWDVRSGRLLHMLDGHRNKIRAIAFDPHKELFYTADNDGVVNQWDAGKLVVVRSWKEANEVHSLALSWDGQMLAAGSKEGLIRLYSVPDLKPLEVLETSEESAGSLAFSPDGRTLASGGKDGAVTLWHVATGQQLFSLPGVSTQVNSLAFSPDSSTLAAATHDGTVILWRSDVQSGEQR